MSNRPEMRWALHLALTVLLILTVVLTHELWMPSIGRSLVCREEIAPSEAIFVENFDPGYLLFERAADLQRAGLATRVLVPVQASEQAPGRANPVSGGIAELLSRLARVQHPEIIPMREIEPYGLNVAYQLRDFLAMGHLRSVSVVTPAFRSRRSALVYRAVLSATGIQVYCVPVFGGHTPENWGTTWHGVQAVSEQFVKLQFYRFYVLRAAGP